MSPVLVMISNPEEPAYLYEYVLQPTDEEREEYKAQTKRTLGLPDDAIMEYKPARVTYRKPQTKKDEQHY